MKYVLAKGVQQEIERTFAPEDQAHVRTSLAEQSLPLDRSAPPPRVHLAIIWLSKGDLKRFDRELDGAGRDWRDTLVAAGLANENWRSVLAARGIDCAGW
jgi:hypothetical protein